ncbi:MAG: hypothetical protein ACXAEX_23495 [Promethearchaeota archaeon]
MGYLKKVSKQNIVDGLKISCIESINVRISRDYSFIIQVPTPNNQGQKRSNNNMVLAIICKSKHS